MDVNELVTVVGPKRLGTLLRQRREESSLALSAAAHAIGITVSALDDVESGRRTAPPATVSALLGLMDVAPEELLPERTTLELGLWTAESAEQVLRSYVDSVRTWRRLKAKDPLSFRRHDLEVLVSLLGTDPGDIERRLVAIAGCSRREARDFRKHFLQAVAAVSTAAAILGGTMLSAPTASADVNGMMNPATTVSSVASDVTSDEAAQPSSGAGTQVGVLQASTLRAATSHAAGISSVVVAVHWDAFAPTKDTIDPAYVESIKVQIAKFTAAGMEITLSPGLANPPSWVFDLDPNTRFIDQHGEVWKGSAGEDVPDAVFNTAVRQAQGVYLAQLGSALQGLPIDSVRTGGLCDGELRYPSAGAQNSYWAFNGAAQAQSPVPGWRPGDPGQDQAAQFLTWYLDSLTDYQDWLVTATEQAFPSSRLLVLYPNWGVRPGQIEQAIAGGLGGESPAERNGTLQQGLDWESQVRSLPAGATVYTTNLAAPEKGTDVVNESPVQYLASLATEYHHPLAGENAGLQSQEALATSIRQAQSLHLTDMFWFNESALYNPAAGAPSLAQLGDAATVLAPESPDLTITEGA